MHWEHTIHFQVSKLALSLSFWPFFRPQFEEYVLDIKWLKVARRWLISADCLDMVVSFPISPVHIIYTHTHSLTNNQRVNLTSVFNYRHTELTLASYKPLLQIPMTTKANTTRPRLARKVWKELTNQRAVHTLTSHPSISAPPPPSPHHQQFWLRRRRYKIRRNTNSIIHCALTKGHRIYHLSKKCIMVILAPGTQAGPNPHDKKGW